MLRLLISCMSTISSDTRCEHLSTDCERFASLRDSSITNTSDCSRGNLQLEKSLCSLLCSARDAMASSSASPVGTLYCRVSVLSYCASYSNIQQSRWSYVPVPQRVQRWHR